MLSDRFNNTTVISADIISINKDQSIGSIATPRLKSPQVLSADSSKTT